MGKKFNLHKMGTPSRMSIAVVAILFLCGCAATGKKQGPINDHSQPVVKSIQVRPSPDQTILEITSSSAPRYTTFQLVDPPRVIVDIRGTRDPGLPESIDVPEGSVRSIHVEEGESQAMTTRIVVGLANPTVFKAESKGEMISIILANKPSQVDVAEASMTTGDAEPPEKETRQSFTVPTSPPEPRIFVKPGPSSLNQVLGVDFVMLERGKSRLVVTTDKKGSYTLDRQGPKDLALRLSKTTIPYWLTRHLDSTHFHGAVDWVQPNFSSEKKEVSIAISLKEMVPFHVRQEDTEISVDFERSTVMPAEKKIIPLQLAQAPAAKADQKEVFEATAMERSAPIPGLLKTKYTGAPMTMDFVNADVTNILRLIGEVSNLNIVWGPDVQGNVSMRLKNVPWDQALDLILVNNNLGKRKAGNVIWITTRAKIAQFEAEEKAKRAEYEAELEARRVKAQEEKEKQKKQEPIETAYVGVDFASADELKTHIEGILTERGSIGVDARTSTLIVKDVASTIEEAKRLVKQFDTPVKQVMIEARIVDATTEFTRDLGVRWDNLQVAKRNSTSVPFTNLTPTDAGWPAGGNLYDPTFSSNAPVDWVSNIGLAFSKLSESGLTATILDAKLALAETEGKTKIISAPKVLASNGETATISRGSTFYLDAAENVEAKEVTATLKLEVTPNVSYNNYVTMAVTLQDESQTGEQSKTGKDLTTKLMIKSGETIVIGGIFSESATDRESGIPGLRRIPLFGWLFKADHKVTDKRELLIFLTPTVVPATI